MSTLAPLGFDPLKATGLVIRVQGEYEASPLGSCAVFRQEHLALTAAHCLKGADPEYVQVVVPWRNMHRRVVSIHKHSSADIALIATVPDVEDMTGRRSFAAFWNYVSNYGMGEEFVAFGFPVEGPRRGAEAVSPRIFRGHYQRFIPDYESPDGYVYYAGELSIPAPGGLSGGPIFRDGAPQMLTGIVTGNIDAYATLDSVEDVSREGESLRIEHHRILSYGVALMLNEVADWLDELAPQS